VIGHVCPEAADGGKLALVKDGDVIKIDIATGKITLDVPAKELQARQKKLRPKDPNAIGWLLRYQNLVTSAAEGAVLKKKF
ncbi:MAG: dihydroxy-acid dehydratase, partial [Clostridiales bacterium]|nr:dihydroxy-acid dehydratase [Clostridiales bacterium]